MSFRRNFGRCKILIKNRENKPGFLSVKWALISALAQINALVIALIFCYNNITLRGVLI